MMLLQISQTFEEILQTLMNIEDLISGLVLVLVIQLIFTLSVARNTQVVAKSTHTPIQRRSSKYSLLRHIWRRLRPSQEEQLPEGDKKELVER